MNQPRASSFGGGWLFFKRIDGAIGQWINRIYDSLPDHFPYFVFLSDRQGTDPHMDEYGRANPAGRKMVGSKVRLVPPVGKVTIFIFKNM